MITSINDQAFSSSSSFKLTKGSPNVGGLPEKSVKDSLDGSRGDEVSSEELVKIALSQGQAPHYSADGPARLSYTPGGPEEQKLLKKIDWHMFPCICFLYMLNHLDRSSIANARIGGMEVDLQLSSTDYSTAVLIFFVGYLLAEIPSNMLLSRMRPSIFLPVITFLWGSVVTVVSAVKTKESLVVVRFFLGFVESGFFPGVLFILSSWYRKVELARRIGILYSAGILSGAFGGLISGAVIDGLEGALGVRGWRWLFIIEGIATVLASLVVVFFLPDWPSNTKWLSEEEQSLAMMRLEMDKQEHGPHSFNGSKMTHTQALMAVLKDWRTYVFSFMYLMISSAATISYFIPTITVALGYTGRVAQFMTVPPYLVACFCILAVSMSADRFKDRVFHVAVPITVAGVMYALCIPITEPKTRYALVCLGFGTAYGSLPVALAWVSSVAGFPDEKRAVTQAFVNTVANSASFYGSFLWPTSDEPRFSLGFTMSSVFCFSCGISAIAAKILLSRFPQSRLLSSTHPKR